MPASEIPDPQTLRLHSWVNQKRRQDSTSADMVFAVAHLVRHLSEYMVVQSGDVINTGTPEGVAFLWALPVSTRGRCR